MCALALNCTLKRSPAVSSSDRMIQLIGSALAQHDVELTTVRVVDHDIRFGVTTDEGDGDEWPRIRRLLVDSDILLVATPIWLGHPSSVCQMVLERLDAELAERDDEGRLSMAGKVAVVAVVGNEDGAHHVVAEVFQAVNDVGFAIPSQGATYWVGEAMQAVDFVDLDEIPEPISTSIDTVARHAVHLARHFETTRCPHLPPEDDRQRKAPPHLAFTHRPCVELGHPYTV